MTALENLAKTLSRLPGIGPKSAGRIAFFLVGTPRQFNELLAEEIASIQDRIRPCSICGSFAEMDPCPVCSDPSRDKTVLCIVEQPQDVISIQSSGAYNGLFHVLGGAIDPLNNVGPEDLTFEKLMERIEGGGFTEVIIATNPTEQGDTTALYIRRLLKDRPEINLTRLASGLPIGGDLEYADRSTLIRSLRGRVNFQ